MKRVTIGIKMDSEFVTLLNSCVYLSQLREKDELTPAQQLALVVLAEARGAMPEQTHACILPCWRPHIEVVSGLRKVEEPK
jgi:hypothetical protein